MSLVHVEANISFRAYRNQDGVWVAVSDPLGLTVEADSWGELFHGINETMNLMLRDLLSRGKLPSFLRARGWTLLQPRSVKPTSRVRFEVPFGVIPVAQNEHGQRVYS